MGDKEQSTIGMFPLLEPSHAPQSFTEKKEFRSIQKKQSKEETTTEELEDNQPKFDEVCNKWKLMTERSHVKNDNLSSNDLSNSSGWKTKHGKEHNPFTTASPFEKQQPQTTTYNTPPRCARLKALRGSLKLVEKVGGGGGGHSGEQEQIESKQQMER